MAKITQEEDLALRDTFIDMVCEESGRERAWVEAEMDYAKEHGIKYKVYAVKGYWNIPHELLLDAHQNGERRRKIAKKIAKERNRNVHDVEKEMIDAKYNLGLRIGYF